MKPTSYFSKIRVSRRGQDGGGDELRIAESNRYDSSMNRSDLLQSLNRDQGDKVKQARDCRNWIAHCKRESRSANTVNLTAREAFDQLKEFRDTLGIAVEAERIDDTSSIEYMP